MTHNKNNLTGQTFGRLTALGEDGRTKAGHVVWRCRCSCGIETSVSGYHLKAGTVSSCGCGRREAAAKRSLIHGQTDTPLHRRWRWMISRTTNPNDKEYANYGGRGISVCAEWRESFEAFARDMGPGFSPELTLDRINHDGNYEPANCRWITNAEQQRNKRNNRRLTLHGKTLTLVEWCELTGLRRTTITRRIDRYGWSVERALTTGADPQALARLNT